MWSSDVFCYRIWCCNTLHLSSSRRPDLRESYHTVALLTKVERSEVGRLSCLQLIHTHRNTSCSFYMQHDCLRLTHNNGSSFATRLRQWVESVCPQRFTRFYLIAKPQDLGTLRWIFRWKVHHLVLGKRSNIRLPAHKVERVRSGRGGTSSLT